MKFHINYFQKSKSFQIQLNTEIQKFKVHRKIQKFIANLNYSKSGTFQKVNKISLQIRVKSTKKSEFLKMYRNQSERKFEKSEHHS